MHHAQRILHVRQMVHDTLRRLEGQPEIEPHESVLIQDGYYCGRRFVSDQMEAVWLFEDDQLKFYHADGTLVEVIDASGPARVHHQRAA